MTNSLVKHWRRCHGTVHPDDETFLDNLHHSFNLDFPPPAYIGDVVRAPVVILLANGGYNETRTRSDFNGGAKVARFLQHLHHPAAVDPVAFASYWRGSALAPMIESGRACVVNACAYRSKSISKEPQNRRLCDLLPSVHVHRKWFVTELLQEAKEGKRLAIVHRWGLWRISPKNDFGKNVRFSRNARGRHLTEQMVSLALSWAP